MTDEENGRGDLKSRRYAEVRSAERTRGMAARSLVTWRFVIGSFESGRTARGMVAEFETSKPLGLRWRAASGTSRP